MKTWGLKRSITVNSMWGSLPHSGQTSNCPAARTRAMALHPHFSSGSLTQVDLLHPNVQGHGMVVIAAHHLEL